MKNRKNCILISNRIYHIASVLGKINQNENLSIYLDALRDLVPSVQFKKREKHPWRCFTFSKVKLQAKARSFTKSSTPPWVFFTFFKLYKRCQIAQSITINKENKSSSWKVCYVPGFSDVNQKQKKKSKQL